MKSIEQARREEVMSLFFAQWAAQSRPAGHEDEGRHFELTSRQTTEIGTRSGKLQVLQPMGECTDAADAGAGAAGGIHAARGHAVRKALRDDVVRASTDALQSLFDWSPSPHAVLRMVDATGEQARPFLEQAPARDEDGDILVIEVDGKGAPAIPASNSRG